MRNKLFFGVLLLACLCYSCDESFLDTQATDAFNEDNFWVSEDNAITAINGCYEPLTWGGLYGHVRGCVGLDNYTPNATMSSILPQMVLGNRTSGNVDLFEERWDGDYRGVGRVNSFLGNVDKVPMNEPLRQRLKGEAYFLRALYYADLTVLFGGVPLITDPPNFDEQRNLPRNTRQEVVSQILADLDNAAQVLPESYGSADIGRATRGAALALKARVLLYESRWQEAAQTAQQVMSMGIYRLYPDYRGLFLPENENNEEVIFDVQYSPESTTEFDNVLDVQIQSAPLPNLLNSYLMEDGLPADQSPLFDPANPFLNRDKRLLQTIVVPGFPFQGEIAEATKYFTSGYGWKKYTSYQDEVLVPDLEKSETNIIVLRYADVLLMYAEAQNESVGSDASVYAALNQVRQRVGMPDIPENLSQDEMRAVIWHERRIELAGEGHYYHDIRRWRIAETVMNTQVFNSKGELWQDRVFDNPRDYLWAIHENTIAENPSLEQNPGY